jgi:hypothetical protein
MTGSVQSVVSMLMAGSSMLRVRFLLLVTITCYPLFLQCSAYLGDSRYLIPLLKALSTILFIVTCSGSMHVLGAITICVSFA